MINKIIIDFSLEFIVVKGHTSLNYLIKIKIKISAGLNNFLSIQFINLS